jgi:hypothetical protein
MVSSASAPDQRVQHKPKVPKPLKSPEKFGVPKYDHTASGTEQIVHVGMIVSRPVGHGPDQDVILHKNQE